MNSFKFFLENAKGKDLEAVHQRILFLLFKSKTIVSEILKIQVQNPSTKMEVHGKKGRLFDLQIKDNEEEVALIELKMWSSLWVSQIEKQVRHVYKKNVELYYILLGFSDIERANLKELTININKNDQKKKIAELLYVKLIKRENLIKSLETLIKDNTKISAIISEFGDDKEISSETLKDFLETYKNSLQEIEQFLKEDAWKPDFKTSAKTAHYVSIFYYLREILNKQPILDLPLYRLLGGDTCMEIRKKDIDESDNGRYIKFGNTEEEMEVDLFLWLKNDSLELNYKKKGFNKKEHAEKESMRKLDYEFKMKISEEWKEMSSSIKDLKLPCKSKKFTNVFKLDIKDKLDFSNINSCEELKKSAKLIELENYINEKFIQFWQVRESFFNK